MGMEYLSEKRIMHGDLAARNVLLGSSHRNKTSNLSAKVADFGLSKQMSEERYYKKRERNSVPLKWMAFEYLENRKLEMKSDVWSYGVVIWEIFALGKEPYHTLSSHLIFEKLKRGEHLECPEGVDNISGWAATQVYEELANKCFNLKVNHRASFSEVVVFLKSKLSSDELRSYDDVTNEYNRKSKLLLDENTRLRLKRTTVRRTTQEITLSVNTR